MLDFLLTDREHGIDRDKIYAVGHSMGGFVCGQLAAKRSEIKAAAILMPCDVGRIWELERSDKAAFDTLCAVLDDSAQWLRGASLDGFLAELKKFGEDWRLEAAAKALADKPLLCVSALRDRHTPYAVHCRPLETSVAAEGKGQLQSLTLDADHYATECRGDLIAAVIDFLKAQA